MFALRLAFL
jgi:hypothetical protein